MLLRTSSGATLIREYCGMTDQCSILCNKGTLQFFYCFCSRIASIKLTVFLPKCRYESIIATLCESLDTLDEPEAKVLFYENCLGNLLHFCAITCLFFSRHQ